MKRVIVVLLMMCGVLYSCEEIISVPDISDENVDVIAPVNGALLTSREVTFSWNEIEFVEQYQIQIATPNFNEAVEVVLDEIVGDSLEIFRNFTTTLEPGVYEWRIRGLNSNFFTGYTTQNLSVAVNGEEDQEEPIDLSNIPLILTAPSDNITIEDTNVIFSWEDIEGVENYRFQIAFPDFENPVQIIVDEMFDSSNSQSFDLEDNTSYQWRVQGVNEISETSFTTRNITININEEFSEQSIVIIAPEDNFETDQTSVNLSWEELEEATLYRLIVTDLSDDSIFIEQSITVNEITVDLPAGSYSWAVRGENTTENTAFTEQTITIIE